MQSPILMPAPPPPPPQAVLAYRVAYASAVPSIGNLSEKDFPYSLNRKTKSGFLFLSPSSSKPWASP